MCRCARRLLETLREYWRWKKPKTWLFPAVRATTASDKHLTDKAVWYACARSGQPRGHQETRDARTCSGTVSPRTCWRTAPTCATIQMLLGHADLEATSIYLHLSRRHLTRPSSIRSRHLPFPKRDPNGSITDKRQK